jgi:hypothetical protein
MEPYCSATASITDENVDGNFDVKMGNFGSVGLTEGNWLAMSMGRDATCGTGLECRRRSAHTLLSPKEPRMVCAGNNKDRRTAIRLRALVMKKF